jgi:hypothetical protein
MSVIANMALVYCSSKNFPEEERLYAQLRIFTSVLCGGKTYQWLSYQSNASGLDTLDVLLCN